MLNTTKKSFILYHDYYEIIKKLPKEQAGNLLSAIFEYEITGKVPELDYATELVFISIRQDLDRNAEKYEEFLEKQRQNGKRGGRPRKDDELVKNEDKNFLSKNPTVFLKTQKSLNDNVNVNDTVNVNENDNVNVNVNENVNDNSLSSLSTESGNKFTDKSGELPKTSIGKEEREILEKYLSKTKPNIRKPKAYIIKLINNGDYADLLKEARAYELKTKYLEEREQELKEQKRLEEEKKRIEEEEKRLQKEKENAEKEAQRMKLYNELSSKEIIERKLKNITDKASAAMILAEYYEQCNSPPPKEFDEIAAKYELDTYEKIDAFQREAAMNRCREMVMRATRRF